MSMHSHEDIICFKHCTSVSIFCKQVPVKCPVCNVDLTLLPLMPVVIPCPLTNAIDNQCCIVVRPTEGCFICDYSINDDLHIGITTSQGNVIEYDKCGLVKYDNEKWTNCIAIQFVPNSWQFFWDETLSSMCNNPEWCTCNYDDMKFNCFTFVISFLKILKYQNVQYTSKEDICESLILPEIRAILKYAVLFSHLKSEEFYYSH